GRSGQSAFSDRCHLFVQRSLCHRRPHLPPSHGYGKRQLLVPHRADPFSDSEKAGTTIGQSKGKGSPYVGRKLRSASGGIREKPGACPGYAATGPIERTLPEQDPRGDRVIGRNPLPLP